MQAKLLSVISALAIGSLLAGPAAADKVKIDEDGFKKDLEFIRAMIRFRIDEVVFGIADARRHLIGVDPQAQVALANFGEAQKLTELSKATKIKAH